MKRLIFILLLFVIACKQQPQTRITQWVPYDETAELAKSAKNNAIKMQFKLIQSKVLNKNDIWFDIEKQISNFTEEDYLKLKALIYEQNIPSLQQHILSGALSYEKLTQWYLYRIVKFENNKDKYLNAIISINPNAVEEARDKDKNKNRGKHLIYGMPILLKDNINAEGMPTSAGAYALRDNFTSDAFIVQRIKENGGIILGKTNLSEWANFLCLRCPNGYSAVGGQTLNPYGRMILDTGGSSSGSGAAIAANYAAAAVGTETSGSILSPSSKNSLVGLKPSVGLLSRGGIVPISGTLDTPGPMTRNVIDNAILLSAMCGEDDADPASTKNSKNIDYADIATSGTLKGLNFGVFSSFLNDSIYKLTVERIAEIGGNIFEFEPERVNFEGFGDLLSADMQKDLPTYFKNYASHEIIFKTVEDVVKYNKQDTSLRIPYGQGRFEGMLKVKLTNEEHINLKTRLHNEGVLYFESPMTKYNLDVILGINNRGAGFAAAALYPCLSVPMGYMKTGEPVSLTFIARPFEEDKLLKIGFAFEQANLIRIPPKDFD